jgi:hypothetical protein
MSMTLMGLIEINSHVSWCGCTYYGLSQWINFVLALCNDLDERTALWILFWVVYYWIWYSYYRLIGLDIWSLLTKSIYRIDGCCLVIICQYQQNTNCIIFLWSCVASSRRMDCRFPLLLFGLHFVVPDCA